jgi:hypothetical protein
VNATPTGSWPTRIAVSGVPVATSIGVTLSEPLLTT